MIHHNLSTCTQKGEEKEMTILVLLTPAALIRKAAKGAQHRGARQLFRLSPWTFDSCLLAFTCSCCCGRGEPDALWWEGGYYDTGREEAQRVL